jgi:hypothetical protein
LKPAPTAGPYGDRDAAVDGAGEYEAAVVVRVLAYKVYAAGGAGYEVRFLVELFPVRLCGLLLRLSQGMLSYSA